MHRKIMLKQEIPRALPLIEGLRPLGHLQYPGLQTLPPRAAYLER
jgi:hypothetical protein